jgi:hypothetical protein
MPSQRVVDHGAECRDGLRASAESEADTLEGDGKKEKAQPGKFPPYSQRFVPRAALEDGSGPGR